MRREGLPGRESELGALANALKGRGPRLIVVTGPRGRGKTSILRKALGGRVVLHFEACDLTEPELLADFQDLTRSLFGEVPAPQRPGVLPVGSGQGAWLSVLTGIVDRTEASGRPLVLVLDGADALLGARRRLAAVVTEGFQSARARGVPLHLVLTARDPRVLRALVGPAGALGAPDLEIALQPLPFRTAGWMHEPESPADAFRRWAVFGDDPSLIVSRGTAPGEESDAGGVADGGIGDLVLARVLTPGGDLFDAPLRRLEATFQRSGRYAAVLRSLARGPLDWRGILQRTRGVESGGQLAPYLRRLEEEGLVRVDLPLDARPGSRTRRYSLVDPFFAFWFGWVLPVRSLLSTVGPVEVWRSRIAAGLPGHFQTWMEEAARRWLRDHAAEGLGAGSREVGALWGGGAAFPVAGRLANGRVCFGAVEWTAEPERDLAREMADGMKASRYGIGHEARTPIFFLAGEPDEGVRRMVARVPYATVVDLPRLMGAPPTARAPVP